MHYDYLYLVKILEFGTPLAKLLLTLRYSRIVQSMRRSHEPPLICDVARRDGCTLETRSYDAELDGTHDYA